MRLYLSSFRLGRQPQRLAEMAGTHKRAAVIANACDLFPEDQRRPKVQQEVAALQNLGFQAEEIDLRDYFDVRRNPRDLAAGLADFGLIWVRGGNTFVLRRAMRAAGFDAMILELLKRDTVVYGGYSAGSVILAPSLHGIELVDDPNDVPAGYDPSILWEGLGLLPYFLAPHYKSDHPESAAIDKIVEYFIDHHVCFVALRDGEAIVVNGDRQEIVS